MAQTMVNVRPSKPDIEEAVSWAECVLAGDPRPRHHEHVLQAQRDG